MRADASGEAIVHRVHTRLIMELYTREQLERDDSAARMRPLARILADWHDMRRLEAQLWTKLDQPSKGRLAHLRRLISAARNQQTDCTATCGHRRL